MKRGALPRTTTTTAAPARPWVVCPLIMCHVVHGKVHVLFRKQARAAAVLGSGWATHAAGAAAEHRTTLAHKCEQTVSTSGVHSCSCVCQLGGGSAPDEY